MIALLLSLWLTAGSASPAVLTDCYPDVCVSWEQVAGNTVQISRLRAGQHQGLLATLEDLKPGPQVWRYRYGQAGDVYIVEEFTRDSQAALIVLGIRHVSAPQLAPQPTPQPTASVVPYAPRYLVRLPLVQT